MRKLGSDFFAQDTCTVARELLGKYLVRKLDNRLLVCQITETEAYIGRVDKACHAYNYKRTARTQTLFAPPGTIYVYLIYGMYHCLNFVTEATGEPCAVLIRAASPILGLDDMAHARYGKPPAELTKAQQKNFLNGPGKLCKALSIDRALNGSTVQGSVLWVTDDIHSLGLTTEAAASLPIHAGPRVNIDYAEEARHFPWRFWVDL